MTNSSQPDPSSASPCSRRVLEILRRYSALAWPILKTQAGLLGLDPLALHEADIATLAPQLDKAVTRFTSAEKGFAVRTELLGKSAAAPAPAPAPASAIPKPQTPTLQGLPGQVLATLAAQTPFAWPILEAHCTRAGLDPARLCRADLRVLIPALTKGLARWASPEKARAVGVALELLAS